MREDYDDRAEELEAVGRIKEGDADGLEVLVRHHEVRALRVAYLIVSDRGLAQDVVQDAFVRAYERIGLFDTERPFGPWFMQIVVNISIRAASRGQRQRSRETQLGADAEGMAESADREPDPHELAERTDIRRRILEALDELPPDQRAAIVQRYYLDMSEAEMSEGGDIPPGTIKWRLYAARKKLSEILRPPSFTAKAPLAPTGPGSSALTGAYDVSPNHKEEDDERS